MSRLVRPLAGLLLLSALLAPAGRAAAENVPVSAAVGTILERADRAMAAAGKDDAVVTFLSTAIGSWSREILTPVVRALDVKVRVIDYHRDVLHQTACLRADVIRVEYTMEKVRQKLNTALEERNILAIIRLTDLYEYLSERKDFLVRGGIDPSLEDNEALAQRVAGPADWDEATEWDAWSAGTPEEEEPEDDGEGGELLPFCYFHTDYLPPSIAGYGCDVEAMDALLAEIPADQPHLREMVQTERDAMVTVQAAVGELTAGARTLKALTSAVDVLTLDGYATGAPAAPRTHREREGCNPDGAPPGAVVRTLRGPFRVDPDEARLLREFEDLKVRRERDRPYPEEAVLDNPDVNEDDGDGVGDDEVSGDKGADTTKDDLWSMFWTDAIREPLRSALSAEGREQAKDDSRLFAIAGDSVSQMEGAFGTFSEAVGRLSSLATKVDGGLRGFVRDYAYFLLRSCMERRCQALLERITRLTLADECFPYVNGAYLKDTCENPRWQKCADDAGVTPPPGGTACPAPEKE